MKNKFLIFMATITFFLTVAVVGILLKPELYESKTTVIKENDSMQSEVDEKNIESEVSNQEEWGSGDVYSEPFAFMIIFILIPGLFCGLWADLSMCLSFFIKNKFFVVIIPYLFLFFEKAFFDSLFSNRIALDLSPFYFMRGESSGNIVIVTIILITMLGVTLFITWFRGWRDDVY